MPPFIRGVSPLTPTPTYSLSTSASSINEGSTLSTTVSTTNVTAGTKLYYSLSGIGVKGSDFSSGSLSADGVVGTDGKFAFNHNLANDLTTEGEETLFIYLYTDSARKKRVASTYVQIKDTSTNTIATYSLVPNKPLLTGGSGVSTTVRTSNVSSGTTLYWGITGSGISASDFSLGGLTGTGLVGDDGTFLIHHIIARNSSTEGHKTFFIKLYTNSARTKEVASTSVRIIDTSIIPSPVFTDARFSIGDKIIDEGCSGNDLLTIIRSGDTSAAQTVAVASRDGSAKAGSDYEGISTSIYFAPGVTSERLRVRALDDSI